MKSQHAVTRRITYTRSFSFKAQHMKGNSQHHRTIGYQIIIWCHYFREISHMMKTKYSVCLNLKSGSIWFPQDKIQKYSNVSTHSLYTAAWLSSFASCVTANVCLCMAEAHACGLAGLLVRFLSAPLTSLCLSYFEACCAVGCWLSQQQTECWWMSARITCDWSHCLSPLKFNPCVARRVKKGMHSYFQHYLGDWGLHTFTYIALGSRTTASLAVLVNVRGKVKG